MITKTHTERSGLDKGWERSIILDSFPATSSTNKTKSYILFIENLNDLKPSVLMNVTKVGDYYILIDFNEITIIDIPQGEY